MIPCVPLSWVCEIHHAGGTSQGCYDCLLDTLAEARQERDEAVKTAHDALNALREQEAATWEAAATRAGAVATEYAEKDDSPDAMPTAETCAAVACATILEHEFRSRAARRAG